ncbi:Serine/threonine-protein phosphatase 7 long form-like protein [Hordeum vulgare]|nr:Serine/threonine-protein phosphatase 7 long form-like protein [Hordeum vulgare]
MVLVRFAVCSKEEEKKQRNEWLRLVEERDKDGHMAAQFGKMQHTRPALPNDTGGSYLHWKSKQRCQSITDWGEEHEKYAHVCNERKYRKDGERKMLDWNDCAHHMR